jgi:hypothetical protein
MSEQLKYGTKVVVHSIGDNKDYRAIIRGIASEYAGGIIYIVEMVDRFVDWNEYPYLYTTVPSVCILDKE